MDTSKPFRRPLFWIGPILFGACVSLGYGITERIMILSGSKGFLLPESFSAEPFPGESLEALRLRHDGWRIDLGLDFSIQ